MNNEMYNAAVEYVKHGLTLIPVYPTSKVVAVDKGWQLGNANINTVEKCGFFLTHPDYNVAVNLAFSDICIVDIDHKPEFKEFCKKYGLEDVLSAWTKGIRSGKKDSGKLIFRKPEGFIGKFHDVKDFGGYKGCVVEFRCGKKYDVLPPSIHPSGTKYEWVGADEFAKMPESLKIFWENWETNQYSIEKKKSKNSIVSKSKKVIRDASYVDDLGWFNATLDLQDELVKYGAIPSGERYVSPFSQTKTAGIKINDNEKWFCFNESDPHADGHSHNAFDVWVYNHFGKTTGELSKFEWMNIYDHIRKLRYKPEDYINKNAEYELIAAIGV